MQGSVGSMVLFTGTWALLVLSHGIWSVSLPDASQVGAI